MERKRFIGIDLGKRTYEIKIIESDGKVSGTNGLTNPAGRKTLYKKLRCNDRVAIKVCSLAMVMAKEIQNGYHRLGRQEEEFFLQRKY